VLRECGHLPDDDPCDRIGLPRVTAKREEDDRWVVDCPYCGREHQHGAEAGDRVAHCHRGDYIIAAPPASRPRKKLPFRAVWDRDDWTCVRCGTHKHLTVDHIVPVSKGGTDDFSNLQTMCQPCNSSKGARF
jgi:5-methylcytosine-specific restriction endonuclease McrA